MEGSFPATENEVRAAVRQKVAVTPQLIAIAKAIIIERVKQTSDSLALIGFVTSKHGCKPPRKTNFHRELDSTTDIRNLAELFTWTLAATEALMSLIHGGSLLVTNRETVEIQCQFEYMFGWPGSGGHGGSIRFDDYKSVVPHHVRLATSMGDGQRLFLSDPDLYLTTLDIAHMHAEIKTALRESVKCFRQELFGAAVTMLGKASEGAWIELGAALMKAVPSAKKASVEKQRKILDNPREGAAKKMDAVVQLFEKQDIFEPLARSSGVSLDELRSVWEWSDPVRDSRNTIHFGVDPVTPNTHEKIAVLLLAAIPNMLTLYRLREAAMRQRSRNTGCNCRLLDRTDHEPPGSTPAHCRPRPSIGAPLRPRAQHRDPFPSTGDGL